MKLFFKIWFLILLTTSAKAQQYFYLPEPTASQADSMKRLLTSQANDSMNMLFCRDLGFYYVEYKKDSAIYFLNKQIVLARSLKQELWEADGYGLLTYAFTKSGKYIEALNAYLSALKIAEDPQCEKNIWRISMFSKDNNPHNARLLVLALVHLQAGHMYRATQKTELELSNYSECIRLAEQIEDPTFSHFGYHMLGATYIGLNKLDSALLFEQKAIEYSDKSGYKKYRGQIFEFIGSIYSTQGRYDSAKKYFYKGIQTNLEQNNLPFLANIYVLLADLFTRNNNPDSSLFYSKKALDIYKSVGELPGMLNAYLSLSAAYKFQNNIDSAFLYQGLALAAKDSLNDVRKISQFQNIGFDEQLKVKDLEKKKIETENRVRTLAMLAGIAVVLQIAFLLYRNIRHRKKANELLQKQKDEVEIQKKTAEEALSNLKSAQTQLIQSEKMASLGELTAGIAHEIQNPLNFVNNFSEVNTELIDEMKEELATGNVQQAIEIANDIKANEEKINHHGKRADAIVKGMLQHSRSSSGVKEPTDINSLCDEYLRLSYHGLRAKDKSFNAEIKTDFDASLPKVNIIPQDIGRVVLNLINNAFYAVDEKKKQSPHPLPNLSGQVSGGNEPYEPIVTIATQRMGSPLGDGGKVEIKVSDNGNGIPQKVLDKIFQPFFTTKPTGQGTGLGLSLTYDIVKAHGGEIKVETKEARPDDPVGRGEGLSAEALAEVGSTFIISLPVNNIV